jgi:type IV pilus assembly protein PilC
MESEPIQLEYAGFGGSKSRYAMRPQRTLLRELGAVVLGVLAWGGIAIFVIGVSTGWLFALTGPVLGPPALVMAVIAVAMLAAASRRVRRRRATAVLGYLRQAACLNLPFNRILASAAQSERGRLRLQIMNLREELAAGTRLSIAVGWAVPETPQRTVALLEYAEQSGQLPKVLNGLMEDELRRHRSLVGNTVFTWWYPPVVLMVAAGCVVVLSGFIFPRLDTVFTGFGIAVPAITRWMIWAVNLAIPTGLVLAIVLVLACGIWLREVFRLRRPSWIFQRIQDRVIGFVPILGGLRRDRGLADVCSAVADSIDAGHSLEMSLMRARQLQIDYFMDRRIGLWGDGLHSGMSPSDAARSAGMPPLLVGLLASGQATPAFGDALRFAGRFYRDRFTARQAFLTGLAIPVFTIALGVIVAMIALSIFVPMTRLIDAVSPCQGGL